MEGLLEWGHIGAIFDSLQELLVLDYCNGFLFEVVVVGWGFINDPFDDVGEVVQSFEEHVHQLATPYSVSHFPGQHFEVTDVLVDIWE